MRLLRPQASLRRGMAGSRRLQSDSLRDYPADMRILRVSHRKSLPDRRMDSSVRDS